MVNKSIELELGTAFTVPHGENCSHELVLLKTFCRVILLNDKLRLTIVKLFLSITLVFLAPLNMIPFEFVVQQ